jgi:hypothetical protein
VCGLLCGTLDSVDSTRSAADSMQRSLHCISCAARVSKLGKLKNPCACTGCHSNLYIASRLTCVHTCTHVHLAEFKVHEGQGKCSVWYTGVHMFQQHGKQRGEQQEPPSPLALLGTVMAELRYLCCLFSLFTCTHICLLSLVAGFLCCCFSMHMQR